MIEVALKLGPLEARILDQVLVETIGSCEAAARLRWCTDAERTQFLSERDACADVRSQLLAAMPRGGATEPWAYRGGAASSASNGRVLHNADAELSPEGADVVARRLQQAAQDARQQRADGFNPREG